MDSLLTDKGVVLMGEASQSWVNLQWAEFWVTLILCGGLILVIIIAIILLLKSDI